MATNLLPIPNFEMIFKGSGPGKVPVGTTNEMKFKAEESKESRNLTYGYELVYHVYADPPNDILFTNYIWTEAERADWAWGSDEVVIGWNTWLKAGWSFFDKILVKKWPPKCTKISHNDYRVVIKYAPLCVVDFQTTPVRAKKKSALWAKAWEFPADGGAPVPINLDAVSDQDYQTYLFINVDEKGKVQGIDVIEPSCTWTERWVWGPVKDLYHPDKAGEAYHYFHRLSDLTASVNNESFRGFTKGCVLFRGATGRYVGPMTWEIDYHFSYRPPKTKEDVHGKVIQIPKELQGGWNHIDVEGIEVEITRGQDDRKYRVKRPDLVKIQQIYPRGNFRDLKIYEEIPLGDTQVWAHPSLTNPTTGVITPPQLGPTWRPPMVPTPFP